MLPDDRDTIVARASAPGGAARGIVRVSGPEAIAVVASLTSPTEDLGSLSVPRRVGGVGILVRLGGREFTTPCDLFLWPGARSYTRQPSVEVHTIGSPPIVEAVIEAVCSAGARLATPGEFTLRALLAGRIDLTQAEAVLGVIDASGDESLKTALGQLAGGLSAPLASVRNDLIDLLADLEAGLDFVDEEDIRFVEQEELIARVESARAQVAEVAAQASARGRHRSTPRVALVGPPNAGKSSLLNALVRRWGAEASARQALVSAEAGTTRDSVSAFVTYRGVAMELVDTAGRGEQPTSQVGQLADQHSERDASRSELRIVCTPDGESRNEAVPPTLSGLRVITKSDLYTGESPSAGLATSSVTGEGLEELMLRVSESVGDSADSPGDVVAETAQRCRESLADAADSLARAAGVVALDQHELVALELRTALDALGRVTGAVVTDDLLDRVFSKFCIGK